jgi:hypothetical protein
VGIPRLKAWEDVKFDRLLCRWVCGLVLGLLVALAQFGEVSHGVSHAVEALAQSASLPHTPQPSGHHRSCDLCLSFGQVAAAIGTGAVTLAFVPALPACTAATTFVPASRHAPSARNRGPPPQL